MGLLARKKKNKADAREKDESRPDEPSAPTEEDYAKADLTQDQVKVLQSQIGYQNEAKANIFAVYRYASSKELALIALAAVCSLGAGAISPLMIIVFGRSVGNLTSTVNIGSGVGGNVASQTNILYFIYLAIASFVLETIATAGWQQSGRRIARKVREEYLRALLKQNMGFYDSFGAGKMTSHITADMSAIQDAISEKVGLVLATTATFVGAFIVGFTQYWALALVLSSGLIAIVLLMGLVAIPLQSSGKKAGEGTAEAATVVDEAFSAIKTVLALNMQVRVVVPHESFCLL
jgi:ATP-binding cassette subfamily B (MDR/TAP) protein 1